VKVGLALSSGGARSFAHIGVIQVLEEAGIQVDAIAGSSMGAYIGALWAAGVSPAEIEKLGLAMAKPWAVWRLVDPVIPPRQGFIRGERMANLLRHSIGNVEFSGLKRPLRVVTTDLETMDRLVFCEGEVARAVQGSMAMPGVFTPVAVDGHLVVDGGVSDPLPVDVLREMGMDRVIAVNTIPSIAELRAALRQGVAEAHRRKHWWRRAQEAATQHVNYFAHFNILDVIWRCLHGQQCRYVENVCAQADVVLRAVTYDGAWHDFRRADRYIRLGREIATARLHEIQAMVKP
jgi:NTE family protein